MCLDKYLTEKCDDCGKTIKITGNYKCSTFKTTFEMFKKWNVIIMADMCPYQKGTFDKDSCLYNGENSPMDCNKDTCPIRKGE